MSSTGCLVSWYWCISQFLGGNQCLTLRSSMFWTAFQYLTSRLKDMRKSLVWSHPFASHGDLNGLNTILLMSAFPSWCSTCQHHDIMWSTISPLPMMEFRNADETKGYWGICSLCHRQNPCPEEACLQTKWPLRALIFHVALQNHQRYQCPTGNCVLPTNSGCQVAASNGDIPNLCCQGQCNHRHLHS